VTEPLNDRTARLIQKLAADLSPVRRIASLRVAWLASIAVAIASGAIFVAVVGARARWLVTLAELPGFAALAAGLPLVALGGTLAAIAGAVPGRELAQRLGLGLMGAGALLLAFGSVQLAPVATAVVPLSMDLECLIVGCAVGLPPALATLFFLLRAFPQRHVAVSLAALGGAVAAGAAAVHLSCPWDNARHLVASHALAPAFAALVFCLPLAKLLELRRG
jgi:hypothetical protein